MAHASMHHDIIVDFGQGYEPLVLSENNVNYYNTQAAMRRLAQTKGDGKFDSVQPTGADMWAVGLRAGVVSSGPTVGTLRLRTRVLGVTGV